MAGIQSYPSRSANEQDRRDRTAYAFGYEVFGPIFAEFSSRLWQFQRFLPHPEKATLLFCARGGLRLQTIYERFCVRSGLEQRVSSDNLMVSRLVAARLVATAPTQALLDELGREFDWRPMSEIAAALAQRSDLGLSAEWREPFSSDRFLRLVGEADGLKASIAQQNALFRSHLDTRTQGRPTILLCDTGLFGSTVRLLRDAMPERCWLGLQFARANYKGYAAPHFDVTVGLSVERDLYAPWDLRSVALRFWHLIESMLEPDLPSVCAFTASTDGTPHANLEVAGWQDRILPGKPCLFSGALGYVDDFTPDRLSLLGAESHRGWRRLKRALIRPRRADIELLSVNDRSRDFGRTDTVAQFGASLESLTRIRASLWREATVVQLYPRFGRVALEAIELAHAVRAVGAEARAWRERRHHPPKLPIPAAIAPHPIEVLR